MVALSIKLFRLYLFKSLNLIYFYCYDGWMSSRPIWYSVVPGAYKRQQPTFGQVLSIRIFIYTVQRIAAEIDRVVLPTSTSSQGALSPVKIFYAVIHMLIFYVASSTDC